VTPIQKFFKKYWYKLTNKDNYKRFKYKESIQKEFEIFQNNFENKINEIQKKIATKKELTFLHSGHIGDIINVLPVIKELSKTHKCNLYIGVNKPLEVKHYAHQGGNVYINEKIFSMLLPLLTSQQFLNKVEIHAKQDIDINFDIIRKLPINLLFDNLRYGFQIAGIQPDINEAYLHVQQHDKIINKIVVLRSLRYRNQFINYNFLEKYDNILYVGTKDEYEDLKNEVKNLQFYDCKDFLEMAKIIKSSRFFVGNSSLGIDIAEALKIPRLLEACPNFPARQVHGKNAYDFYYQVHFEKFFKILYEKN
tara:strand:+ start:232 stop:1155 length:924 start_codon:yes stop_codon:yes gene_type:complete